MRSKSIKLAIGIVACLISPAQADDQTNFSSAIDFLPSKLSENLGNPKSLKLGLGLGSVSYPHYPGSEQSDTLTAPVPYIEYRGEYIQIDDDGFAAHLLRSQKINLDFSISGALPVDSDDNRARAGMPDLEFMFELGPELEVSLFSYQDIRFRLDFPLRAAVEIGGDDHFLRDTGFTFEPRLHAERRFGAIDVDIDVGALFANARYMANFYQVGGAFATADRIEYEAKSGQMAWRASASIRYQKGDWVTLGYLRALDFSDSDNKNSPLLLDDSYLAAGFAVIRLFGFGT
jgi:outer membrane scaffolding protein for murein synthesis (MipA/OmpV family)